MKAYTAYNLSRKRFKEDINKEREIKKAELYHGRYIITEKYNRYCDVIRETKPYVKRYYRSGHNRKSHNSLSGFHKRYCNRRIRRIPVECNIKSGSTYKKLNEYWWTID